MATVYKIENPKGECYVGSTVRDEILTRRNEHKFASKKGRKGLLYDSFRKYGFDKHTFSVLGVSDKESVRELEHFIIQESGPKLNQVTKYNATAVGKTWVNNGVIEFQVDLSKGLIPLGFIKGRKPNSKLGRRRNINI